MKPALFLREHRSELALYDRMASAIEKCERVDEVKEIRNRARAMEIYAAQALNHEAEQKAARIRLRAERRCGELLREMKAKKERHSGHGDRKSASHDATPKSKSNGSAPKLVQPPTLSALGITRDQAAKWQLLADIPKAKFEERLNKPDGIPSTHELIVETKKQSSPTIDPEVLFIWGRICDFERHKVFNRDPTKTFQQMTQPMQDDICRLAPQLIVWLDQLAKGGTQ